MTVLSSPDVGPTNILGACSFIEFPWTSIFGGFFPDFELPVYEGGLRNPQNMFPFESLRNVKSSVRLFESDAFEVELAPFDALTPKAFTVKSFGRMCDGLISSSRSEVGETSPPWVKLQSLVLLPEIGARTSWCDLFLLVTDDLFTSPSYFVLESTSFTAWPGSGVTTIFPLALLWFDLPIPLIPITGLLFG